jgi:phosphatidylserine/phosphatidylglycerophosphate/cardiolipin synthase-like enzyme
MFKYIFICLVLYTGLFSNESNFTIIQNQTYFLPQQSNEAKDKILSLIENSKTSIKISMYNFSYKKIAKELVLASKKGVKIQLILDKKKIEEDNEIYKYLKNNGINIIIPSKNKLHTKIAVFDDNTALIGSMNWTKESFEENYEMLLITSDNKIIKEINIFLNSFIKN